MALVVGLSVVVVSFGYWLNKDCLMIGLDGTSWLTYLGYQHNDRLPFAQIGADPVQGNFDAYFPVANEYLLPEALTRPFADTTAAKAFNYSIYYLLMMAAFYLIVRSIAIPWQTGLLAANLFAVLGFPGLMHLNSQTYGPFNFAPHIAQSIALSMFIVAAFWALNPRRIGRPTVFALLAVPTVCFLIDVVSLGAQVIFIVPATALYGAASLLEAENWRDDIPRIAAVAVMVLVAWVLGIFEYFHGLIGYSAFNFFSNELVRWAFDASDASTFWFSQLGRLTILFGLMGAAWSVWFGTGRARLFAATHIVVTVLFIPIAYAIVSLAKNYNGTMPARFEMCMWPYALVFSSVAIVQAVNSVLDLSRPFLQGRLRSLRGYGAPVALAATLAAIAGYNAGQGLAYPGRQCAQAFSPIRATPITDVLQHNIALAPGATFNGVVATIAGVKDKPSVSWLDLHFHDYQLWQRTGNDHRLVGLWHFGIPTLFQYFAFTTPPYYLLLTEFLSRPEDKQFRSGLVLTRVDEKMLRLWGVRYVITDGDSSVGRTIVDLPVADQGSLRLGDLAEVNLGDYSPTEVRRVADYRSGIAALHEPDFDGRRTVVTEADLRGTLTGATRAHLLYMKYGLDLHAESRARSLLVLPVQYSHCWSVEGGGDAQLFRADMMQLGVIFTGTVDLKLVFRYGPLLAGACRVADLHDMTTLRVAEGRAMPRSSRDQ
jgi:hypothetical protein